MRDLTEGSGLPLRLDERSGVLHFGLGLAPIEPGVRRLGDLRPVLAGFDPRSDDLPCYYMYRDLRMTGDETLLAGHGLHYDVTVTLPGRLGDELMKTAGHYHNYVPGTVYTYTEVYEVLSGQAIFLLQRVRDPQTTLNETVVEEVLLIGARAGEVMLIPSHMGHVTINAGAEPLVVAALVSSSAGHQYGPFRQARGAAYYVLAPGMPPHTRANPAYGPLPQPRWYPSPTEAGLGLRGAVYQGFRRDPDRFAFLTDPTLL